MKIRINLIIVLLLFGFAYTGFANVLSTEHEESQVDYIVLTAILPSTTITTGRVVHIYGTREANHIILESGAEARLINSSGNNSVTIQSDSSLFTVSRSGATVLFEGSDGTVLKIPATTISQSIIFNDETQLLIIDSNRVMVGDQVIDNLGEDKVALNYNEDGSSIRVFSDEDVNNYVNVQERLSTQIDADDDLAFHNTFEIYVNDLLDESSSIDSIPSYAPRGELKNITIDVVNGKIDYTNYILIGDINLDSEVDFTDLEALKTALLSGLSAAMYDVNSDDVVDVRDMIFLLARIGTEVSYFDFYTIAGEKISNIPIREASDPRSFDYAGPETQVMVVPKDINKASGFTAGLSDIDDVWYKKTGWIYQEDAVARRRTRQNGGAGISKGQMIQDALNQVIDFDEVKNNPYLVGWHLAVRYVDAGTFKALDDYGMDGSESYILPYENRIRNPHFAKTTMMHDKRVITKNAYVLHLGTESDTVNVSVDRQSITGSLIRGDEKVVIRQVIQAASITFTSKEEHILYGNLMGSNNNLEGTVKLYRIGPYPNVKDYGSVETTDGNFSFPNLPYGAYKIDFENKCGCSTEIENGFVFTNEETNLFEVAEISKNVNVGLTIVDDSDEPLTGKSVVIKSSDCVPEESRADGTTNDAGFVEFNNMPIGEYDVYVDGKVVDSIKFCDAYTSKIVVSINRLWNFRVDYKSPYGNGSITASDISIDFEAEADPGGAKVYAMSGTTCGGALYGCGGFYIFNDTIVKPGSKWVSFDAMITIDAENKIEGNMISGEMDYGMNGLVCDGHIPAGFGADSSAITWSYANSASSWTLTLEPCSSGGCN